MKHSVKLVAAILAMGMSSPVFAESADEDLITPYANMRYRLELVDQEGLPEDATASTFRLRAGVRTGEWNGLSALVEGEAILAIGASDYNYTMNGMTAFPVVADPEDLLLNQAWLRWRPLDGVEVKGGRQVVNLDNQRWMGSVGWRQNDQTFDALRASVEPLDGVSADYIYSWRVNRIFGPDSPMGIWRDTDIHGARLGVDVGSAGTVSAYGYWLDIPAAPTSSSRTFGVRFAGSQDLGAVNLLYAAEYARQTPHGANPNSGGHDYMLIEPGFAVAGVTMKFGFERLDGDGTSALQTPLATLHAFNGWSDKFLGTPANGLRDLYIDARYRLSDGPLNGLGLRAAYHDFSSTRLDLHYGSEIDAVISYPVTNQVTVLAKLARYEADDFASDTTKFWFGVDMAF